MTVQEKATRRKRRRQYEQVLWITLTILGSMTIAGGILVASAENYDWLLK
jgi:hypothetical protein